MIVIRTAVPDDSAELSELYRNHLAPEASNETQNLKKWAQTLEIITGTPGYYLFVGEEAGRIVSSVTLVIINNLTHGLRPYAVIENVVTRSDYRNRGYASALMKHACETARNKGCYKIMLMTGSKKESTLNFYKICGFDMNEKTAFIKRFE